jgi:phosphatidate cytidylyltransferase
MARSDLGRRVGVAAIGIPAGLGLVYLGGWFFAGVIALLAVFGVREVYALAAALAIRPFSGIGLPAAAAIIGLAAWFGTFTGWAPGALAILIGVTLLALAAAVFRRGPSGLPLASAAVTVVGVAYAAVPMAFAIFLRGFPEGLSAMGWSGTLILVFPLFMTWLADTAAYFVGVRFGRRKLLPSVSPGKTVEGSAAGLCAAVAGAVLYSEVVLHAWTPVALPIWLAGAIGLAVGIAGAVGDLSESVLKREAGVKDSGSILPGHGGILDRFDGVYLTLPLTYALIWISH